MLLIKNIRSALSDRDGNPHDGISGVALPEMEHKYEDIQIRENWFATHIALSYVSGSTRYITYANELNVNKSIHRYWNTKST